jgi:hypothetical protein
MSGPRPNLYYSHSGSFSPPGFMMALGIAVGAALVLAFVYAYFTVYIPVVGTITFVLSAGFGALVGAIAAKGLELGKVRNVGLSVVVVLVASLLGYYVSWAAWLHALLNKAGFEVGLGELLTSPALMWDFIVAINESGSWTFKDLTPTGGFLWVLWALEAVLILGVAIFLGLALAAKVPFCERCNTWTRGALGVAFLDDQAPAEALRDRLEDKDLAAVEAIGAPTVGDRFYRLDLHECPQCKTLCTLDASLITIAVDKEGNRSEKADDVCKGLLLEPEQAQAVRDLGQRLAETPAAMPAPPADELTPG